MKRWIVGCVLGCALSAMAETEWVRGEITKIAPERGQITLRHEPIKSLAMGAMTMPYKVDKPELLQGFKPGEQVRFSVKLRGELMVLDALERVR